MIVFNNCAYKQCMHRRTYSTSPFLVCVCAYVAHMFIPLQYYELGHFGRVLRWRCEKESGEVLGNSIALYIQSALYGRVVE